MCFHKDKSFKALVARSFSELVADKCEANISELMSKNVRKRCKFALKITKLFNDINDTTLQVSWVYSNWSVRTLLKRDVQTYSEILQIYVGIVNQEYLKLKDAFIYFTINKDIVMNNA